MTTAIFSVAQLQATQKRNFEAGGNFLGCVIGWKVNSTIRLDGNTLTKIAEDCNLPLHLVPKPIKPASAFRKAIEKTKKLAKKQGLLLRYIGDLNDSDDQSIYVGLVEETANITQQTLDYDYIGLIHYEQADFQSNITGHDDILLELRTHFNHYQEHTSDDIYKVLTNFAHRYSIRLTPYGGSYFVPALYQEILESVRQFIVESDSAHLSKVFTFEMFDSPANQSELGDAANSHLEAEISELASDLDNFLENAEGKRFEKGLSLREKTAASLKARVKAFASVLDFQSELLYAKLSQIENLLNPIKPLLHDRDSTQDMSHQELLEEVGF